jgi:hypothetical protein
MCTLTALCDLNSRLLDKNPTVHNQEAVGNDGGDLNLNFLNL